MRLDQLERFFAVASAEAQKSRVAERHVHHVRDGVVVFRDHDLFEEHRIVRSYHMVSLNTCPEE